MNSLIDMLQQLVGMLPWEWAHYEFMQRALLAVLLAAPLFALVGTQVVWLRMAFFSDTLGHAALAGLALGVVAGLGKPLWAMIIWAVAMALMVTWVQRRSQEAADTVLGVFMAFSVALGIALLARNGRMKEFLNYLIGDVLSISAGGIAGMLLALIVVVALSFRWFNALALTGLNASLAGSRGVRVGAVQAGFAVIVAVVVTMVIPWVGLLLINAFLILPAATARLLARDTRQYVGLAIGLALVSGVGGLISSYYWGTATGATIVLWAVGFYSLALIYKPGRAAVAAATPGDSGG